MEPEWEWGTKVFLTDPGHMIKMAAFPFMIKKNKKRKYSSEPKTYDLDKKHWGLELCKVYINYDIGLVNLDLCNCEKLVNCN